MTDQNLFDLQEPFQQRRRYTFRYAVLIHGVAEVFASDEAEAYEQIHTRELAGTLPLDYHYVDSRIEGNTLELVCISKI